MADFLNTELKLELSLEKTKITDLHHDRAKFLGFYIQINKPKENVRRTIEFKGSTRKVKVGHNVMIILMPKDKIYDKLIKEGFMRVEQNGSQQKYVPIAKTPWICLDHRGILNRYN